MPEEPVLRQSRPAGGADILALGFGATLAMWTIGYVSRYPELNAPAWLVLVLLLASLFGGGLLAGWRTDRGIRGGMAVGFMAGLVNLLVLGSLLSSDRPNQLVPSALLWLPGALLASTLLGAAGALVGKTLRRGQAPMDMPGKDGSPPNWTAAFAGVAAAATFLLLVAGGIVTSHEAGLAVADWPNSYGYNMFLYPLARMTGGIYYEHAHRLLGSLVGLTTLVLVIHLLRTDPRRWLKRTAVAALVLVVLQGILGGLRVTGRFTMSASPADTAPNLVLAVLHGITGQIFFAVMTLLAVFTSRRWRLTAGPLPASSAGLERSLARLLAAGLLVQLALGAVLRHESSGLLVHVTMAAVVVALATSLGVLVMLLHRDLAPLPGLGRLLLVLTGVQVGLGLGAMVAVGAERPGMAPLPADLILTTAHQATGALLLACAVSLTAWLHHVTVTVPEAASRSVGLARN
jgi:cytochrome c oxidase assembly protein subunit 15